MKKFLSIIILAIIFVCGQNNFANAQDVYAGNTGGLDFYVDTNSISLENSTSFYVNVKKVDERSGHLKDTNQWKFYMGYTQMPVGSHHKTYHIWVFDYYLSGKNIPVESNHIAKNILSICKRYDSRIKG